MVAFYEIKCRARVIIFQFWDTLFMGSAYMSGLLFWGYVIAKSK